MKLTKEQLAPFFKEINERATRVIEVLMLSYFGFGIFLAFFYDTWLVAIGVGTLSLALYYSSKFFFPGKKVHHYMSSMVLGIFMAQFIYQMHGLFEMHFTAFVAIIALMAFQNIWVFIPLGLFIGIHHGIFAYVQYLGFVNDNANYKAIYFTQLDYMDLQTFLFHAGLVVIGVIIAAIYSEDMRRRTKSIAANVIEHRKKEKRMEVNVAFANKIADGNYDSEYELDEEDTMGNALINMREGLKESEIREQQERFTNKGLTEAATIIRNNNNLDELSYEMVAFLVKYLNLNQGGVFVLDKDEETDEELLILKGCYAYQRKKYIDKKIEIGQGLVGQCYLEKDLIYLKEIPSDYINITSGLGEAPPSVVVLVPIKNDDIIEGVIELAGFRELEAFERDFLSEVAESLAVALNTAKVSQRTQELYAQSQQQAEEMRAQEEEMRQNMEELSATQEDMERASTEMREQLRIINSTMATVEFDFNGIITDANENFLELMGYRSDEVVGKHHRIFVSEEEKASKEYEEFWDKLGSGESFDGEFHRVTKQGRDVWIKGMYSPMMGQDGRPIKIVKYAYDITKEKELMQKFEMQES